MRKARSLATSLLMTLAAVLPIGMGNAADQPGIPGEGGRLRPAIPPISWHLLRMCAALLIAAASPFARAQPHTVQSGEYVLRASTVVSTNLSEETARRHGIKRSPRRAILNVTVLKPDGGNERTVAAEVKAFARTLTGQRRIIALREVTANGYVNYLGSYDFVNGEVLDFNVTASPESGKTLTLTFRDRLWVPKTALP